jgi:hypothetical protein
MQIFPPFVNTETCHRNLPELQIFGTLCNVLVRKKHYSMEKNSSIWSLMGMEDPKQEVPKKLLPPVSDPDASSLPADSKLVPFELFPEDVVEKGKPYNLRHR